MMATKGRPRREAPWTIAASSEGLLQYWPLMWPDTAA